MVASALLLAAMSAMGTQPPPATTASPPPSPESIARVRGLVDLAAATERRHRFVYGSLKLALGTFDVGVGLYSLLALRTAGPTVSRSATVDLVAGGGLMLDGVLGLARRGPLETLLEDPTFARLARPDPTARDLAAFDRRFAALARRGRIERQVAGALSLAGGAVIGVLGGLLLFDPQILQHGEGEVILGGSMIGSSLAFISIGIQNLALPSQVERALEMWRTLEPPPVVRVRVSPGIAGVVLTAAF